MFKAKFLVSLSIFITFLLVTSSIKNKTRIIEKNINLYEKEIFNLEKELYESQLDFYYLTSPKILHEKISFLTSDKYQHMGISKIYLDYNDFISSQKKISKQITYEEKKNKK